MVQLKQLADRGGGAEDARGAGDVPAGVVVCGIDGIGHSRLGLEAEHERLDKPPAADTIGAGVGEGAEATGELGCE